MVLRVLLAIGIPILSTGLAQATTPRLPADHLPVPILFQATEYSCGAAATVAMLFYFKKWYGHESELYGVLDTTPKDGTDGKKMAETLRAFGLSAELKTGMTLQDLRWALAAKNPVILDIQAWPNEIELGKPWRDIWEAGHYVILIAMDRDHAYFMDPSTPTSYTWVPLPELMERWHDYDNRTGVIDREERMGIVVSGSGARAAFPGALIRLQ